LGNNSCIEETSNLDHDTHESFSVSSSQTENINNDSSRSSDNNDSSLSVIDELDSIIINDVDIHNNA
jgi:hypothetical protein